MILRRVTALLTTLTMLHLAVVSGDGACGEHGAGHHGALAGRTTAHDAMDQHDASMPAGMVMAEAGVAGVSQAHASNPPCTTAPARRCCESVAGCSLTGTAEETVRRAPSLPDVAREQYTSADAPSSPRAPPEPPPPKA
ncbi:MAG: hypothetical protein M3Z05_13980 [Gemmatimonadota bacterium]|nr:hypothetical protein [Gemmatimonadota bacterium]